MITGFEKLTEKLSESDKRIAGIIRYWLEKNHRGKANVVPGKKIVLGIKQKDDPKFSGVKLRKIINFLRRKGNPICGSSYGYWWADNRKEVEDQILSLSQRRSAIEAAENGLKKCLN